MIPHYFKKDSRVWLHKNSKRKRAETEFTREYGNDCYRQQTGYTMEDEGWDHTPYITGADGKAYKKDSRTWLHKASDKTGMKGVGDDSINDDKPAKNPRRMWDVMKRMKELASQQKAQNVRAQDSNEMIRGVINTAKRKKNNTRLGRGCGGSISHRDIHIVEENEEMTYMPLNNEKRPRVGYVKGSYSDLDNTHDDSSSESDNDDDGDNGNPWMSLQDPDDNSTKYHSRFAILNRNGCDSLPLCRSNASIELSQEGLNTCWEGANQVNLQSNRRSYLIETPDLSVMQEDINPMDLTVGGISSRSSLNNMCGTNLSDECVTALEEVPGEESDYQLSEATQGLNVKSPTILAPATPAVENEGETKIVVD